MSAPTTFQVTGCNSFEVKTPQFSCSLIEKPKLPNLTLPQIGKGQPRVIIYTNFVELHLFMLHAKFQDHRTSDSGKEDFKAFYHIWVWCPSWSFDLGHLYKLSFPIPKKTPEIWL